jgi:N-acetylmuramoyl-L-alanine amidase
MRRERMKIENHRLVGVTEDFKPEFQLDEQGGVLVPEIAVIHYAVTESAKSTAAVLKARQYVSCHLSIDSAGRIIQQVPFNRIAWHAGASSYKGRPDVNRFSLGIEIGNPGPLVKQADGSFKTTYGASWKGGVVEAFHRNGSHPWRFWAEYSQTEIDLVVHICELWRQTYDIVDVVGHDEIAPGRKSDPGPAFPIDFLRATVFPGAATDRAPPESRS